MLTAEQARSNTARITDGPIDAIMKDVFEQITGACNRGRHYMTLECEYSQANIYYIPRLTKLGYHCWIKETGSPWQSSLVVSWKPQVEEECQE